jgi:UrcA family protein
MSRKFAPLFAALAIVAATAAPAFAQPGVTTLSERVVFSDLDLSSPVGVKTLKLRVKMAIDGVCGRSRDSASRTIRREIAACRAKAMEEAVVLNNDPLVASLLNQQQARLAGR